MIFGLIGAVGTDLKSVHSVLESELAKLNYKASRIRLSELLTGIPRYSDLTNSPADKRYDAYMSAGTDFRTRMRMPDAVTLLAVGAIRKRRRELLKNSAGAAFAKRHAFVLHSLKRPEEIQTLRRLYGPSFFAISAYSPRRDRLEALAEEIARTRHESDKSSFRDKAEWLVRRDEEEVGTKYGQNVREAFPAADVVIRADSRQKIKSELSRFLEILFEHPFHTPTVDELSMFMARASSLRSADLSRQVGAIIATDEGEVLATGCNEVPKANGGAYWPGEYDYRDFQRGEDPSSSAKRDIFGEILMRLKQQGWLSRNKSILDVEQLVDQSMYGDEAALTKGARLMGLLEFGRVVHAEMAALMDAVRRGVSVRSSTMYTTTFPCHICARHIIAAGITRVVYIDPYPKSMAWDLYQDSISVDAPEPHTRAGVDAPKPHNRVRFEPFVGVAPRRFIELFEMPERKDSRGKVITWIANAANPRVRRVEHTYVLVEPYVMKFLGREMAARDV